MRQPLSLSSLSVFAFAASLFLRDISAPTSISGHP